ncbi:Hypothetical protein R9X50_00648800 [Acrodontium crateriforme]|uniref:dolichol kinase n=1 Tax=Acrodontium crateriforme TaxID=150365 RepID=A0AAQ3M9R6_9PEZI|nr:Hypothetical protein R9X50_00648800 [Acrodontium crateriforme]
MSSPLNPASSTKQQSTEHLITDEAEALRSFNRTPRPYFRDGQEVHQNEYDTYSVTRRNDSASRPGYLQPAKQSAGHSRSGRSSAAASDSGTEADDERPSFVKALPPASVRLRKGLKSGEENEDSLLTPSQLDDQEGRLSKEYFQRSRNAKVFQDEAARLEQEKFHRLRVAEFVRRMSEVALMGVMLVCVLCGRGVLQSAERWILELTSHLITMAVLILIYPVKLSIVDTRTTHIKLWQRFRVPASFDPATVLYPPLLPVLVALSVSASNPKVVLPNIILGLASLPQRLFPRSSRLGGFNTVHWLVSIIPLIVANIIGWSYRTNAANGMSDQLATETLVSLYPLHHALLQPLHHLTKTSLLISELHLLSTVLINLLLLSSSPQVVILKACLWIGGASLLFFCAPVLHWNVTLARVPKWKLRRPGHSAEERKSLVDAVSDLINLQRAAAAFGASEPADSDADEDEPVVSMKRKRQQNMPRLHTIEITSYSDSGHMKQASLSAVEPRASQANGFFQSPTSTNSRPRRNTVGEPEKAGLLNSLSHHKRSKPSRLLWCLQLTPEQADRRKWIYAGFVYLAIIVVIFGPVSQYIMSKALHGQEPIPWALSYMFGQLPFVQDLVNWFGLAKYVPFPSMPENLWLIQLGYPLDINAIRHDLGLSNVRLLLIAYWGLVLLVGLLTVFSLTAFVEVDTRRKVFHGVMVAMLVPAIFVDPCYCALALALALAIFLILEVIRAGHVPPLANSIGRFVAPYVDGRDLRGPVVVSHIFLLIGCAVPLWFSLASIERTSAKPWIDWELASNSREVSMIAGVVCVGMGDAAASLIGRRYGRHKWIWVGGKSLEGSAAFAVAVTIGLMSAKAWLVFGGWNDATQDISAFLGTEGYMQCMIAWAISVAKAALCACGASFMEAVLTGANDNVVVPVALWLLVKGLRV